MKTLCEQIPRDETASKLREELRQELCGLLTVDRPWQEPPDPSPWDHTHRMWRALASYSLGMRAHAVRQLLELRRPKTH